ncbi:hypothetical protein JOD31_001573 [Methylopila capsulata]|uniref:Uncharacterized protein n=1 Tax=Methylopila capsulata TaxID=61654 RepID=A0A9W6ISH3_9HYPH|nr:hypothetical protein [Methylopila capsulata]MBM7851348.1 hypothetical protein [Methylopila capsulata]GLK54405.1 hypothetical protein GCM10008170_04240 [Methylopila capsulata]
MEVRSALEAVCSNPMTWPKPQRLAFLIGLPVTLPLWLVAAALSLLALVVTTVFVTATSFVQEAWADIRGGD